MEYKDYYQILGVERSADEKDIRRAFRKLARTYHPDVNPGDEEAEERFKEINEAYEVLSDAEKRQKYDQLGSAYHDWQRGGRQPGDFDWSQWATGGAPGGQRVHVNYGTPEDLQDLFGGGSPFSDFFSQIFGGVAGGGGGRARTARGAPGGFDYRTRSQRGQDYEQEVEITLHEAYQGTTRTLQKDGRRLQVKIPAGARTGTRIRLAGEGGAGGGSGQSGDLFLRVRVQPDARFERRGDDLYTDVSVNLYTAVLGGEIQVPTLEGAVMLNIPAGTQNGQAFRLRGKGMPHVKGPDSYGDLYAKVDVQLPTGLTPRQRELFEELQAISR